MRLLVLPLCLMLAGCGASTWFAPQHQAASEEHKAEDDQSCRNFGTQPGTPAYDECRKNLDSWRRPQTSGSQTAATQPPASHEPTPPVHYPNY